MARYIQRFSSQYSSQDVLNGVASYLTSENFEYVDFKGENVWKKGHGLMTAPQYIKLTPLNDGTYVLEAWLKYAILPGVYVGEMGITGFFAAVPKGFLKARVEMIFRNLNAQMLPMEQNGGNAYLNQGQPQQYAQPQQYQQAQPQQTNPFANQQAQPQQTNPFANQQAQPQQTNPFANQQAQPQQTNPFANQQQNINK